MTWFKVGDEVRVVNTPTRLKKGNICIITDICCCCGDLRLDEKGYISQEDVDLVDNRLSPSMQELHDRVADELGSVHHWHSPIPERKILNWLRKRWRKIKV